MASVSSSSTVSTASSQSDNSSQESRTESDEEKSELYECKHLTLRRQSRELKVALKKIKVVENENAQLQEKVAKLELLIKSQGRANREIELRKITMQELKLSMEQDTLKNKIQMDNRRMELASRRLAIEENKSKAEIKRLQDDQNLKSKRMDREFEIKKFEIKKK